MKKSLFLFILFLPFFFLIAGLAFIPLLIYLKRHCIKNHYDCSTCSMRDICYDEWMEYMC